MTPLAEQLLDLLRRRAVGRQNAIKADVLATCLGTTWRKVQAAIAELRNEGVFVASSRTARPRGLYLPATEEERRNALGSFRRATLSQITTYNRLKRARFLAVRHAGQRDLF